MSLVGSANGYFLSHASKGWVFPVVGQLWLQTALPGSFFYGLCHLPQQNITRAVLVPSSDVQEKMRILKEARGEALPSERWIFLFLSSSCWEEQGRRPGHVGGAETAHSS